MANIVIFGNSGSGKSTLAKHLVKQQQLAHLDLDTIAWQVTTPVTRMPLEESNQLLQLFLNNHSHWVIEGCYSDLLSLVLPQANEVIFLNLPIDSCIANAKKRPWEPHKYSSQAAQDANLPMLIDWISQYSSRNDTFSEQAHQALYDEFTGKKTCLTINK